MIVNVGFLSALEQKEAPSERKMFFTSHVRPQGVVTDFFGSKPMIAPPTSCFTFPPGRIALSGSSLGGADTFPPMASIRSANVRCMCFTCRSSCSDHFQWNRRTDNPHLSFTVGSRSQKEFSLGIISPRPENPTQEP